MSLAVKTAGSNAAGNPENSGPRQGVFFP